MRTRRRYAILGILAVVLLVVLQYIFNLSQSGKLTIHIPANIPVDSASITITGSDGKPRTETLQKGASKTLTLAKGIARIDGAADNIRSAEVVEIKGWGAATEVTSPSGKRYDAQKLGSNVNYCPVVVGDDVFSNNCQEGGTIYHHTPIVPDVATRTEPLFDEKTFGTLQPYLHGYLGLTTDETNPTIVYVDPAAKSIKELAGPNQVPNVKFGQEPFIVTPDASTSTEFAMVFKNSSQIYLFKDMNDQSPKALSLQKGIDLRDRHHQAFFQVLDDTFVFFWGNADPHEGDETENGEPSKEAKAYDKEVANKKQHIFEYNFAGELKRNITVPSGIIATLGVAKIHDSFYSLWASDNVGIYKYADNELTLVYNIGDVNRVAVLQDKAYFVLGDGLFVFEPEGNGLFRAHGVFSSPALRVTGVGVDDSGSVVFWGNSARKDDSQDIFRLLNTEGKKLLEETMPVGVNRYVRGYDYDDKTIMFELGAVGSESPSSGELLNGLKNKLNLLHADVGGRNVILAPFDQ